MTDPKDDLVAFLRNNFDTTQVSVPFTTSDDITHSKEDGAPDYPKVVVVSRDPVVVGGGNTAATSIDPGGAGPNQDVVELVQVDCWGGPNDLAVYEDNNTAADLVANELAAEVHDKTFIGADGSPSGYEWISSDPPTEADDVESHEDTHHREIVTVRLKWTKTP